MADLPNKAHFTIQEVALYWNVSEHTVRRWIRFANLKAIKVGGVVRVERAVILEFPIMKSQQLR